MRRKRVNVCVDRSRRVDLVSRAPLGAAQIRLVDNFVTIRNRVVREVGGEKGRRKEGRRKRK